MEADHDDSEPQVLAAMKPTPDGDVSASADPHCVICLDQISDPCEAQPCGHRHFDFVCIANWLEKQPTCPLCKADVDEVRYEFCDPAQTPQKPLWQAYRVARKAKQAVADDVRDRARRPRQRQQTQVQTQVQTRAQRQRQQQQQRRRQQQQQHAQRPSTSPEAIQRRRRVYAYGLLSMHVGTNQISRYRNLTPELFRSDPQLISRAKMWIRRELLVFEFLANADDSDGSDDGYGYDEYDYVDDISDSENGTHPVLRPRVINADHVLEYVIYLLKTMDLQDSSGNSEDLMAELLGRRNARVFLHELRAFLRSPHLTLEAWDSNVQYEEPDVSRGPGAIVAGIVRVRQWGRCRSLWNFFQRRTRRSDGPQAA